MTPTGWEEIGTYLVKTMVGSATRQASTKLLQALLNSQAQEISLLQDIQQRLKILLSADSEAAGVHIKHALLPDRPKEKKEQDIIRASDLYIRAISQQSNDLETAMVHRNIAVCAAYLKDNSVTLYELACADEAAEKWLNTLNYGETEYSKKIKEHHDRLMLMWDADRLAIPAAVVGFAINPIVGIVGFGTYLYAMKKQDDYIQEWGGKLKKQIALTQEFRISLKEINGKMPILGNTA